MLKIRYSKKGVVLFIVLGVVLITATLAAVILTIVTSHYRLTHHQSSRIQAYYAAMAGINYALGQLSTGNWSYPTNCSNTNPCPVSDSDFPGTIKGPVNIIFCPPGQLCSGSSARCSPPTGNNFCVNAVVNYSAPTP